MSPRTQTRPLDDPRLWRRLLSRAHPDAGGDHDLFIWTGTVKDAVCGGELQIGPKSPAKPPPASSTAPEENPRIPYPDGDGTAFESATAEALRMAEELGTFNVYGGILRLLRDCEPMAQYARQERRGASFKQLAAIAHTVGMSSPERSGWYRIAEAVPLSDRHAGHLLGRLKKQAA